MGASQLLLLCFLVSCSLCQCGSVPAAAPTAPRLLVNASQAAGRAIPDTLFGVFFEEINHAGAGGLWAELVSNRGFESGGRATPSHIIPWDVIGDDSHLHVATEYSSCFEFNKIALKIEVICADSACPAGGVGVFNPGFWGMNIEQGKTYNLAMYARSSGALDLTVSLTDPDGKQSLATAKITAEASHVSNWTKFETKLEARGTNPKARLQLTTTSKGVIWIDQVSLMPTDTYKGHGFRKDLFGMVADLKPRFLRFPGGCFVEGEWLRNAFRWKQSIGPWEERPGHFGDVWMYWTDDGLGYYEFLQLSEDLGTSSVWVINNGVSHEEQTNTSTILAFVQEALDSIEFARGDAKSTWGSKRASMGHPEPFDLRYVAVGNEDCSKPNYIANYVRYHDAIKKAYPDIEIITNCDGSTKPLDHPADIYDFHIYTSASKLFAMSTKFDQTTRKGPKAFVSEYAVTGTDAGKGSLLAALGEAGFLIGLERNSDIVEMACYAPLFVNTNDRRWNPDAIVFNSWQSYGTPSYWLLQQFFSGSSGATLLKTALDSKYSSSVVASAIARQNPADKRNFISIKIVNFGSNPLNISIALDGLDQNCIQKMGSTKTVLTSKNLMDENSFEQPKKVVPVQSPLANAGKDMDVTILPYSVTSFDLLRGK